MYIEYKSAIDPTDEELNELGFEGWMFVTMVPVRFDFEIEEPIQGYTKPGQVASTGLTAPDEEVAPQPGKLRTSDTPPSYRFIFHRVPEPH